MKLKTKINQKPMKNNEEFEKQKSIFLSKSWRVVELCLEVLSCKLKIMQDNLDTADISKIASIMGAVFDRYIEVCSGVTQEKPIKKLEDF